MFAAQVAGFGDSMIQIDVTANAISLTKLGGADPYERRNMTSLLEQILAGGTEP